MIQIKTSQQNTLFKSKSFVQGRHIKIQQYAAYTKLKSENLPINGLLYTLFKFYFLFY